MTEHPFLTMDVFTDRRFGGNPLAIFPRADDIPSTSMQAIAAELNLSETVFVTRGDDDAGPRVRIFTPKVELPFAGHPLVGTAIHLAGKDHSATSVAMTVHAGTVHATVKRREDGMSEAAITAPHLPVAGPDPSLADAAAVLSISRKEIAFSPRAYSAGVPYAFIPVASREVLSRVTLDPSVWSARFKTSWAPALFPFSMEEWKTGREVHGRMFAPGIGINEDPATGSAAAALAGLLAELQTPTTSDDARWTLFQGDDMGRPSRIGIDAEIVDGQVAVARIFGTAVDVFSGTLRL